MGSTFSMSGPITKVVKNDAYTAPRAPAPVAPARPSPSPAAFRSSSAALKPVSRTLQQAPAALSPPPAAPAQVSSRPLNVCRVSLAGPGDPLLYVGSFVVFHPVLSSRPSVH